MTERPIEDLAFRLEKALRWKMDDAGFREWPLEVAWNDQEVRATLVRGELRITDTWRMAPAWWQIKGWSSTNCSGC